jgi:hypothetical protein
MEFTCDSSNNEFNGAFDELPFDILSLIFSFLFTASSPTLPSHEARNLKLASSKLKKVADAENLPTWCPVGDFSELNSFLERFMKMGTVKIERAYSKYKDHFPFNKFESLASIYNYALNYLLDSEHVNDWVRYLLNTDNVCYYSAHNLLNLAHVHEGVLGVNWTFFDADNLSLLLDICGKVQYKQYKSAYSMLDILTRTLTVGCDRVDDVNKMLFFRWKNAYIGCINGVLYQEIENLRGRHQMFGFTKSQFKQFKRAARSYIDWLISLSPEDLNTMEYKFCYSEYVYARDEFEEMFPFIDINVADQILYANILTIVRPGRRIHRMSIHEYYRS